MKIGWSNFALSRHINMNTSEGSRCTANPDDVLEWVKENWHNATPGYGREDLSQVVVVTLPEEYHHHFTCPWIHILNAYDFRTELTRRQSHEEPYLKTTARGETHPVRSVRVVLYSRETLLENDGEVSGDYDWEIVCVLAGVSENEPMDPLTMSRNFLSKPGGTFAPYTAEQFAESIDYWKDYVMLRQ